MRLWSFALLVALVSAPALADEQPKPVGPAEAAKKVDSEVVLQMEVKSSALSKGVCFLNSEKDYKDAGNFTLFIDKAALAKFKDAKIDDPAAHYKGKTVVVKGKVVLYRDKPEIKVSGADDIKVFEKSRSRN
jgi:DNA/RNA endonuclease YhcR with UshA esterase domain